MKKIILILIGITLLTSSCEKNEEDEPTVPTIQEQIDNGTPLMTIINKHGEASLLKLNYQGGKIVHIDKESSTGLIISPITDTISLTWGCEGIETGATGEEIGDGQTNTNKIISICPDSPAATFCDNYSGGGYTDWFLPNVKEIIQAETTLDEYNYGQGDRYWSSNDSQNNNTGDYSLIVEIFSPKEWHRKRDSKYIVRPMRLFSL